MRIGIIGGTGGMGEGFALRWCLQHNVIIGSRDAARVLMGQELFGHCEYHIW